MASVATENRESDSGLLRNRNFVCLWCAYGISAMGDHLSEMAILKTQGAASANIDVTPIDARITFLLFVPFFLLAPVAGWLADRLPRRRMMIVADLARGAIMFAFLFLMGTTAGLGTWGPLLPILLIGTFAALFSPARSALLPTLIRRDQLIRANGMISGLGVIATMIAIFIGGTMINQGVSPDHVFRIDAGTYVLSAVFLFMLRPPKQASLGGGQIGLGVVLGQLLDGFRYVWCHKRVLQLLIIGALIWFCGSLVKCVIPAVVRDAYGYGEDYQAISTYRVYLGLGFILGAVIITLLGKSLRSEIAITWGLFVIASSVLTFALSVFLPVSAGLRSTLGVCALIGAGMSGVVVMASFNTLLQKIVANRYRGRVFGVKDLCCTAALLTATGTLGVPTWTRLDDLVGYILLFVAVIMFVTFVIHLRWRLQQSPFGAGHAWALNLAEFIAKFWWRTKQIGRVTVPHEGAVIVTSNHVSTADPCALAAIMNYRPLSFMVAAEYTTWPVFGRIMTWVECIPVRRNGQDAGATKQALRHLRAGKVLGIFIQGRTVAPGTYVAPKDGVAMLALRTGATVIPAYISGMKYRKGVLGGLFSRHNVGIHYGEAVDLSEFLKGKSDRDTIRAATQKIYAAIKELAPPDDPNLITICMEPPANAEEQNDAIC